MDSTGPNYATSTGTAVNLRFFSVLFWYSKLILKGVKEPSEPERGAKAHEVRRRVAVKSTDTKEVP